MAALVVLVSTFLVLFSNGFLAKTHAAGSSLYLGPTTGTFAIGDTFTVGIYLNTNGEAVNALEADLAFPHDKLQVVSPSSSKSFIQTWITQPTYSNSNGTLHFAGAIPTPGIVTSDGLVSSITFRVINTGTAVIRFEDTSRVLLNDGQGTDVLHQKTDGIYYLTLPPPQGPIVTSPTNPDQSKWYTNDSAVFRWEASPPAPQGFSYILSDAPVDLPDDISEGTKNFISYSNLSDGTHYFHIKTLRDGVWGGVTHFAVRIDHTPPAAFTITISPNSYTSNRNPVIQFQTTDAASGIDHYELKLISLDQSSPQAMGEEQPFFIEASSPYTQTLSLGSYDVIVRAYDFAGNFYQATERLTVVNPIFEVIGREGLRVAGLFVLPWWVVVFVLIIILAVLLYALRIFWHLHRDIEKRLEDGAAQHPEIAKKLQELKEKQRAYEQALKRLVVLFLAIGCSWSFGFHAVRAAASPNPAASDLTVSPPIVNLAPSSISNDEILYLGGWANVPSASVVIYIEQTETGNTFSGSATTGSDGNWFYSFPQLLDPGHYVAWAELKSGVALSPPSARVSVTVTPTALRIGNVRLDYQELYLILFIVFLLVALALVASIVYHGYGFRRKKAKLAEAIHDAEESLRRGFAMLRRDIELQIATIQKAKLEGALSDEEKSREEKLMSDLQETNDYIGKEIWKIEEGEKGL